MKTGYSDITIVLDRSGSMASIRSDTEGGFNTFVEQQKALPGECKLTLAQFDDQYEIVYAGVPLGEVTPLKLEPRGMTALLDAIGRTINAAGDRFARLAEADRPEHVIFVILTDGLENASKEFTREKVMGMIKHQSEAYKWAFVFLGANQDAIATGASIGIAQNMTLSTAATAEGTRSSYDSMSLSVGRMRGGDKSGFTDWDRKKQREQGAVN